MGFLLGLKQSWHRSKVLSGFLLNLFEIELLMVLSLSQRSSILGGIQKSIFPDVQQFQGSIEDANKLSKISVTMLVLNLVFLGITLHQSNCSKCSIFYSKELHKGTIQFLKIFPFIGYIPLVAYELKFLQNGSVVNKILSVLNVVFFTVWSEIEMISSWSYRFKQVDFCNSRHTRQIQFFMALFYLILKQYIPPAYSAIAYLIRALTNLVIFYEFHDYQLVQKVELFYGMLGVYFFGIVFAQNMWGIQILTDPVLLGAIIFFGIAICYFSISPILLRLSHYRIEHSSQTNLTEQPQSQPQNLSRKIQETQNILRILTKIYVQKQKYEEEPQSSEFHQWWQVYNRIIMIHRIECLKVNCFCKKNKLSQQEESNIYMLQLLNLSQSLCLLNSKVHIPKLLFIYLLIQIAKKPLKAYYELIRFKQEKSTNHRNALVEMEYLTIQTRECFAQVFAKNKAMNQQLQLMKVIEYEEIMCGLQNRLNGLIGDIIIFYQVFLTPTAKASKIKEESLKINQKKQAIQKEFYNLILNYADSSNLNMMVTLFYNFIQIYRSKEGELRKLGNQINLRKRIYHKTDSNIFSPQYGSIYIDLVQERGKILNLTTNMCAAYGYSREEMVGYNVRRFMPSIYSKHHDRFLSNFVEKGKLRLLRSKQRVIFAKNKKKFIFPVNVRLKAEYLLENQFGSTSLINAVDTSSQFLMVSMNGKLQEITEGLYRKIFNQVYRDQVGKCNRLSVFKLIPSLNKLHDPNQEILPGRIYQGLILTSSSEQTLNQKFRYARDILSSTNNPSSGYVNSQSVTGGSKMSIISAQTNTSLGFFEQNEILDWLTETYRMFLVDLNILNLKGFKISYKVSNVHTSEFDLMLVEIVAIESVQNVNFWKMLIEQLRAAAQIYQLNEQHGPIAQHLDQLQQLIYSIPQSQQKRGSFLVVDNFPKFDFTSLEGQIGQLRRKRQSYSKAVVNNINQKQSSSSLLSFKQNEQAMQTYQCSQQSSIVGNLQVESKRQILLTAFNSYETIISQRIASLFNFLLLFLLFIIIALGVFTFTFVYGNVKIWKDVKTLFIMEQVTAEWIALEEVETFASYWKNQQPIWGQILKNKAIQIMNHNLQQLPIITQPPLQFYTQSINLTNPATNITSSFSFIQLLNRYFYMMSYHDDLNVQEMRSFRGQLKQVLQNLRIQRLVHSEQIQSQNAMLLIILVIIYSFLLLMIHVLVLVIYLYYRGQEERIISLLSYMSRKQIKKQTIKLRELRQVMKSKVHDSKNIVSMIKLKEDLNKKFLYQTQNESVSQLKPFKLQLQNDKIDSKNSLQKTKLILILVLTFVFLSNFAIVSFWASSQCDKFFDVNIKAAEVVFEFETRVPVLIGAVLGNVNRVLSNRKQVNFNHNGTGYDKLFIPASQLSKPKSIQSPISSLTHKLFPSPLCQIVECPLKQDDQQSISFEYLVYDFYKKFQIILPTDSVVFDQNLIKNWVDAGNIQKLVNYLEQIIKFSSQINSQIDAYFSQESRYIQMILIICCVIMVPLNILIIIYAQRKFFLYLNHILSSSEELFMHFPVNVLTENTYLLSYFSSKIKGNK